MTSVIDQRIVNGEKTVLAKQGDSIEWIITANPKNADFEFSSAADVTLTGAGVNIISPSSVTNNSLVFKVTYTAQNQNETKLVTVGGTGADLIFEVSLLTVSIGDAVTNGNVSPALATYTTSGANNLNVDINPISSIYCCINWCC